MRRELNPALDRLILDALAERYKLFETREPNHLSTYIYCLTKAFLDQTTPIQPTDTELLLFATGYGLQEVMTPSNADAPILERDGVIYRPDAIIPSAHLLRLTEMKSTRAGVKRYQEGNFPSTWLKYMAGGIFIKNHSGSDIPQTNSYDLIVIYLSERPTAKIISETVYFDADEIEDNWKWILEQKQILDNALETNQCPTPFKYCEQWMCASCRYKTMCDAITMMQKEVSKGGAPS